MLNSQKTLIQVAAALLATTTSSQAIATSLKPETLLMQTSSPSSFPLPSTVPSGTTVKVNGSTSMTVINEALKQGFEEQYSGTTVELASSSTNKALQALQDGKIDLAAIGRPLTAEEKAQELQEVPINREKIAIIVSSENPFTGDITFDKFAKIFWGEITDWSELGGAPGAIRFIDRPASSDTRISLSKYDVFLSAPFQTGSNATQVEDDTAALVNELGKDGISYAIASQVVNQGNVRIISMHETLPDNPAYPFSHPRSYVYKGEASPAVQAFLGFATAAPGQAAIQDARVFETAGGAATSPDTSSSPNSTAPTDATATSSAPISAASSASPEAVSSAAEPTSGAAAPADTALAPEASAPAAESRVPSWLGWLLLPLAAAGLWWWVKERKAPARGSVVPPAPLPVAPPAAQPAASVSPIAAVGTTGAAIAGATALGAAARGRPESRIVLTPRDSQNADAYWEAPDLHRAALREQGGRSLKLRVADVTDLEPDKQPPHSLHEFDLNETDQDRHVPIPHPDRDYTAEIGYETADGQWLQLARSAVVRVPSASLAAAPSTIPDEIPAEATETASAASAAVASIEPELNTNSTSTNGIGLAAGAAGGAALAAAGATEESLLDRSTVVDDSRIVLAARDAETLYAYWETPPASKTTLQTQGGQQFQLRLYDTTGVNLDKQPAHSVQTFELSDMDQDLQIPSKGNRSYTAEIGYKTLEGHWLKLARSNELSLPDAPPETDPEADLGTDSGVDLGIATAGAAMIGAVTAGAAPVPELPESDRSIPSSSDLATANGNLDRAAVDRYSVKRLTVDSRRNCFLLDPEQMHRLQTEIAASKLLEPGKYVIRIKEGSFGYRSVNFQGEPIVLIWIYGGTVINQKTNVPVRATWSTLNGYNDTLSLEVLEPATLSAFFFDIPLEDNEGEVGVSVVKT
ncbi:DUF4912 domain-containing protein [Phormidium tenue FACHB-886]|nr:DUF4912 domain-containing protein [Phormidium tenue FACHB-886]